MNQPILPPGRIYAWLLILLLIALSACTPDGEPAGPALDEAQIYSAVIREQVTVDDTFGGGLQPAVLYILSETNDAAGDPGIKETAPRTLPAELQTAITEQLADLNTEIIWVASRDEVPIDEDTGRVLTPDGAEDGALVTVGNIHEGEDDTLLVSSSIYVAGLAAGGQTYVLEEIDGVWTITGTTGVQWIS